jgi:hypothetical protein
MTNSASGASRERQLQLVAGFVSIGCGLAAVLIVVVGLGRAWVEEAPPRASFAGAASDVSGPPRQLTGGEAYVRTKVLPSGDLSVTQWIESDQLLFGVRIRTPLAVGMKGVAAEDVRVVADGRAVTGPDRISGVPARYAFLGASSVQIRYVLTGATQRSTSAPGRALVRPAALDVSYDPASERVTKSVMAAEVLALACAPAVVAGDTTPCGTRSSDSEWTVELEGPHVDDRVLAQLTLD